MGAITKRMFMDITVHSSTLDREKGVFLIGLEIFLAIILPPFFVTAILRIYDIPKSKAMVVSWGFSSTLGPCFPAIYPTI